MSLNQAIIEVRSTELTRVKEYNRKMYGTQHAAINNGGDFPLPINVNVEQGHEYPPGQYVIDPRSFTRDDMGNLKIKGLKLLPLGGTSAQPARK